MASDSAYGGIEMKRLTISLATLTVLAVQPEAQGEIAFDPQLDLRYRFEHVDQDDFERDAEASTLRTRLGLAFEFHDNISGLVEFEDVRAIGWDAYNSTANARTEFPVVADPEDTELNQAWIEWRPVGVTAVRLGRQRIILDNARFVGNVGFRQNEQTFDAATLRHALGDVVALNYSHITQVNRIFGAGHPDRRLARTDVRADLVNLAWDAGPMQLVGYGYWLDNRDARSASTRTVGARWSARHEFDGDRSLRATLEYATQEPHRRGAEVNDADYWRVEAGWHAEWLGLDLAQETLSGNGDFGFSTPLATLHAFQGWADMFLSTPPDGIVDRQLRVSGAYRDLGWQAVYHDFRAERGDDRYGTELNLSALHPLGWGVVGKLEYADYDAREFAVDTRKFWLTVERRW